MSGTVLILASPDDGEARRVGVELRRRGQRFALLDLSWFPQRMTLTGELTPSGWESQIVTPDGALPLADITSVYQRRCPPFEPPEGMNDTERRFSLVEARFGLGGVLMSLPAHWVSHPTAMADAEYKPFQLAAARRAGLSVPETWIGNDPVSARAFVSTLGNGGAVYKPLMHKLVTDQSVGKVIYTSLAAAEDVDDRVSTTAHLFQARVGAEHDVRALVTSRSCAAVAIRARRGRAFLDYRDHYDALTYERTSLPADVLTGAQRMLANLGLAAGVCDFAVTTAGETVFYEVNPAGQWAWLEEETGAPMTRLICDELTGAAP
ncbi:hypothetical protein MRI28_10310 [Nocardiopsis dassonvillei]|uniref:MvdC/MvdD family ATP grasp protein n=1 Tax=Nocardiopsis dassonvillei TaxID=2014 RepID=UPI00200EBB18|nr:hypothetical protein [Nocardiopsis dassonvillei]MCK9870033.1 hypothetical protein [Nocardiopsis dassonvillei]